MTTIAHSEYLLLNSIQRDGYKDQNEIEHFEFLKKNRWIERCEPTAWEFTDESTLWRLSSQGRLEHNLYEKTNNYCDGYKLKFDPI